MHSPAGGKYAAPCLLRLVQKPAGRRMGSPLRYFVFAVFGAAFDADASLIGRRDGNAVLS
jgi:hypothetical protein